jgi:hypothetical protein
MLFERGLKEKEKTHLRLLHLHEPAHDLFECDGGHCDRGASQLAEEHGDSKSRLLVRSLGKLHYVIWPEDEESLVELDAPRLGSLHLGLHLHRVLLGRWLAVFHEGYEPHRSGRKPHAVNKTTSKSRPLGYQQRNYPVDMGWS